MRDTDICNHTFRCHVRPKDNIRIGHCLGDEEKRGEAERGGREGGKEEEEWRQQMAETGLTWARGCQNKVLANGVPERLRACRLSTNQSTDRK